ncbi:hypothetical protein BG003_010476 [Podila horticola]|nr:hypothetical protein BG003_010476 [Podila horticola]
MSSKVQRIMVQPIVSVISMCLTKTNRSLSVGGKAPRAKIPVTHQRTGQSALARSNLNPRTAMRSHPSLSADGRQRKFTGFYNLIFRYLQQRSTVQIWLYEQVETRIEGQIIGFDEFMNLVLEDAHEVNVKKGTRKSVGRILLKGDNITLIQSVSAPSS